MSKQSRDVAAKNIQHAIRKVASETSQNNKLEVMSSTTSQSDDSSVNTEEILLKNENVGRTANYNFFQLQNIYSTTIFLKDVKIVVNTGFELVRGSGIDDICVYELVEFNKIYSESNRMYAAGNIRQAKCFAVLCAMIAAKVLQRYTTPENDGFLRIIDVSKLIELEETRKQLKLSNKEGPLDDREFLQLQSALKKLKKLSFYIVETTLTKTPDQHAVNTPAYHVDSQLGLRATTEPYLEERREIELDVQRNSMLEQYTKLHHQHEATENLKMMTTKGLPYVGGPAFWTCCTQETGAKDPKTPVVSSQEGIQLPKPN